MSPRPSLMLRGLRVLAVVGAVFVAVFAVRLWSGGYLDRDPVHRFPAQGKRASVQVVLFSGDAGVRFGMGPYLAERLVAQGIETTAIASSTAFRFGADRQRLDTIVARSIADVEAQAQGRRLIIIAQSYGADVAQTGLASLPLGLRRQIAGVILIVPGTGTYFRADPLGLLYDFRPDSRSIDTLRALDWTPLTCIYGLKEEDSVCPLLPPGHGDVIGLPGGHYFNHDKPLVAATVMHVVHRLERGT